MKITVEDVRHVAILARLRLSADEEARLVADLDAILGYVDKLAELDVAGVEPTAHGVEADGALREDVITNEPAVEELLANAPDRSAAFFRVPKIIE